MISLGQRFGRQLQSGWQLTTADDSVEIYSLDGRLRSITTRAGLTTTLSYDAANHLSTGTGPFGHTLSFTYDGAGHIAQMTAPDGGVVAYAYDANKNLTSVTYPDTTVRQYVYENPFFPNALTGIIDENGVRFATYAYSTRGQAVSSEHAGGVEKTTIIYNKEGSVTYNRDGNVTVTDARGNAHGYQLVNLFGVLKPVAVTGVPVPTAGGKAFTYDKNGFLASRTDFNDHVPTYVRDAHGLELSCTEAAGTPLARTITTTWHAIFHLPTQITEPNRVTTFTYDAHGNLLQKTIRTPASTRTWKYTYNGFGQVLTMDGSRTDIADVTRFTYDSTGALATVTNTLGQVTRILSHDADGRPLTLQNPNGLLTTLTYDVRGRLTSRTVGTEITRYDYDKVGQLTKITLPDGSFLTYRYDDAHRLTQISDQLGNSLTYTLDATSNRIKEEVFDPSNVLTQTRAHAYDEVNRLAKELGAQQQTTKYDYDTDGNLTGVTDPLGNLTATAYDALNRLVQITDPNAGVTRLGYDVNDQLKSVTDPRSFVTAYGYDWLGDLTTTKSPDTGATENVYDAAGNRTRRIDARGTTTTYTYDALNRVTALTYADGGATFIYDQGANGLGHLTQMNDGTGQTNWTYDQHGRVLSKTQKVGTLSLTTIYGYDTNGRLASLTYPSGQVVTYPYTKGQVTELDVNNVPLLTGIQYEPFGPARSWTWGNGAAYARQFDQDGRAADYDVGPGRVRQIGYDQASRITGYTDTDTTQNQQFGYDALGQLKDVSGNSPASYDYDVNGNRKSATLTPGADTYAYVPSSNQLANIAGLHPRTYSYDQAGNITRDGVNFTYDGRGRLKQVSTTQGTVQYGLNGLGQRVTKPGQVFIYDEAGHLLGEYTPQGQVVQETVYLGDTPVAVLQGANHFFIYADHLNAPRTIVNVSNVVVWRWDSEPFGTIQPTGTFTYNLRYPGQYFDKATGLFYNMARDYNPLTGRYIESDPIGLVGGINTYAYVGGEPTSNTDPYGLSKLYGNWCGPDWTGGYSRPWNELTPQERANALAPIDALYAEHTKIWSLVCHG